MARYFLEVFNFRRYIRTKYKIKLPHKFGHQKVSRTVTPCSYVHKWVKTQVSGSSKISYLSTNRRYFTYREVVISIFILLYREHSGSRFVGNVGITQMAPYPVTSSSELSYTLCYVSTTYHRNVVVGRAPHMLRIPIVSGLNLYPQIRYPE